MFIGNSIWHLRCEGSSNGVSQPTITDSIIKPPKPPTVTSNGKLPVPGELPQRYRQFVPSTTLHNILFMTTDY